jgi:hypothetical protein
MTTSKPFFLAYGSSATQAFSAQQLIDLLGVSRANNERAGITGMLLHRGGNFLQALEGPEDAVRETMQRITSDRRHGSVLLFLEEWPEERLFADWSMAFEDVSQLDPAKHPGLSAYLAPNGESTLATDDGDHDVFEFFRTFREHLR